MPDEKIDQPWWLGTNYEVLEPLVGECGEEFLQATFTPNNGIRISVWDTGDVEIRSFNFSEEQAKFIDAKLIKWGTVGHT